MDADDTRPIYQAVGCARCDNIGYKGRVAIMELFKLDAEIDEQIARPRHRARDPHARRRRASARSPTTPSRACSSARRASRRISRVVDLTDRVI
jgi:general secretion pathway protein E/type IV pilus assembly protein PilB